MEFHIKGVPGDVSRYVFCPGSQSRAQQIAEHFENKTIVSEERGIVIYSGTYRGVFMTSCGTGMGGPATAIATEELGHLGADTFIRVGSCGVLQPDRKPGDVIIATGTVRLGGTGNSYLPPEFPAVPTFVITQALVAAAEDLGVSISTGVGIASDAFYGTQKKSTHDRHMEGHPLFIEMESDTLFVIGRVREWRTGALFSSDGASGELKPESGREAFANGTLQSIRIALEAMHKVAVRDNQLANKGPVSSS